MSGNNVHSTLFLKYLRVSWHINLLFALIVFIHFLFLFFFPGNSRSVTETFWFISQLLTIAAVLKAFRKSRAHIKKAWFYLLIYGFLNLIVVLTRSHPDHSFCLYHQGMLSHYLPIAGNLLLVVSLILFSNSGEASFKIRRELNLLGLILTTIIIISYIVNYTPLSETSDIKSIISATIAGVVNLSAFIIGLGIYWMGIWKKDIKRKALFIIILSSTFLSFILNNLYYTKINFLAEYITRGYPDLLGTAGILLVALAAWLEVNVKDQYRSTAGSNLFYVSRIERIIPLISLISMFTVIYFNLSKLDTLLIQSLIILMIPYFLFLLFFELYSYRSEDAILSVLSVSPTGIHITDRKFQKTYFINKSLFNIFKSEEIPPDLITGGNIPAELKQKIITSVEENTILDNVEMVLVRPDGSNFNAQCRIIPAKYYSYDVVISWIWDITERKKYEGTILHQKYSAEITSLYKSELLNNLSNRIQSGYVTMKPDSSGWPDFILTGMNRRVIELFGFDEDLIGKKLRDVFPGTEPSIITRFFEVLNTGVSTKRELYFKDVDKTFLFLIFRASFDEVACLIDDITESKRKEKELIERERELSALLGNFPGLAYRCKNNREWTMLFVSPGSLELSGFKPEELIRGGMVSWNALIYPDDRERVWRDVQNALLKKEDYHLEYRIITRDLSVKNVWEKGLGVYDENNELLFLEGFILDITKQKEAEAVLRDHRIKENKMEKARALSQMAGGIAHDLNNHLMGIGSYTSLIEMKLNDSSVKKYTEGIHESIIKSTELIENLLIFARQSDITTDSFSIHTMLNEITSQVQNESPESVKLNSTFNAADDTVKGDFKQIYRSVIEIIYNAKDAMPEGGTITITTENKKIDNIVLSDLNEGDKNKNFIVIKISDSGTGIEKDNLGRIFDPFYTTKPVGKGKGLSLSAVYGTIQAHKGAITVDSNPGRGTTFSVYLPVI